MRRKIRLVFLVLQQMLGIAWKQNEFWTLEPLSVAYISKISRQHIKLEQFGQNDIPN